MRWCLNRWRGRAALLVVLSALAGPALADVDDGKPKADQKIPEIEEAGKRIMEGKLEDAYKALQEACKKKTDLPPARLMLARLMIASQIRDLQSRIRPVLELAISENPDHPVVYLENANIAMNDGRVTEAMLNAERALQLGASARWTPEQKKDVEAGGHAVLARAYESRANWEGARTHVAALLAKDATNGQLRVRLAQIMFRLLKPEDKTGDVYAELKKAYDDEKKAHPDDPKVDQPDVNMGRFWAEKGESVEARKAFEKAVKVDEKNLKVDIAYADWLMQKNEFAEAKARIDAAAKIKPTDPEVMKFQGLVARVLKEYPKAVEIFKQVLNTAPDDTFARNHLALVLIDMGGEENQKLAIGYAELSAKANPKAPEALATLGYVYYKAKRTDEALQVLQGALQASNNRLSPDTAYYLAMCLNDKGKTDEAKTILKEALSATGLFIYKKEATDLKEKLDRKQP